MKRDIQNPVIFVSLEGELSEVFEELVLRVAFAVDVFDPGGIIENIEDRADTLLTSRIDIPVPLQAIYVSRLSQIRMSLNTL